MRNAKLATSPVLIQSDCQSATCGRKNGRRPPSLPTESIFCFDNCRDSPTLGRILPPLYRILSQAGQGRAHTDAPRKLTHQYESFKLMLWLRGSK
jgi:hypothetical protein